MLITRPAQDAAPVCEKVAALGFVPIVAPLFEVRRLTIVLPPRTQAILVTSGNALASLEVAPVPLLAVGDATAERARTHGFADVHSAAADATALAALASGRLDAANGPLLLASGAGQGMALAADLRRRGFSVVRRVCYEVHPVRSFPASADAAIRAGRLHAAMFLSAETAAIFVRLLPSGCRDMLGRVTALAIGQSTVDALESLPWLRICRAPAPTLDDVLAQL